MSGRFNLNSLPGCDGFEVVEVNNVTSSTASLTLKSGTTSDVVISGTGRVDTHVLGTATVGTFQGGDGLDRVFFRPNSSASTVSLGGGRDQLYFDATSAWNPNIKIDGGTGFDTVTFQSSSNQTYDLRLVDLTNIEQLHASASNTTILIAEDTFFTQVSGSADSKIVTNSTALDLTGKSVTGVTIQSSNPDGTTTACISFAY